MATAPPFPESQLKQIAQDACNSALSSVTAYNHSQAGEWNSTIITKILESITSATPKTSDSSSPPRQYKYIVHSTIIQHLAEEVGVINSTGATSTASQGTSTAHDIEAGAPAQQTISPPASPAAETAEGGEAGASAKASTSEAASGTATAAAAAEGSESANGSARATASAQPAKGRRGLHSATGAYWNESTDGMLNYKWEGAGKVGMDVVVCMVWCGV